MLLNSWEKTMTKNTKKYSYSDELVSDLHKDAWGSRPSQIFWLNWKKAAQDTKQTIWDNLIDDMVRNDAEEIKAKKENASNLAKRIKEVCKLGANNYRTAVRWIIEADELEHDLYYQGDHLAWEYNIDYKHKKLFQLAGVA